MTETTSLPASSAEAERPPEPGLPLGRLAAFAAPAGPVSAIDTPISVYLPAFYAGTGLGLGLVGAMFLVGRLAEIPVALSAGAVSDRFGRQQHRRKFWLVVSTPLAMASMWRLMVPPAHPSAIYLLGWLLAVVVSLTFMGINHVAWGSETAGGYHARTRIQAARQIANVLGLVLVLIPPILIERMHPAGLDRLRMLAIGGFFVLLLPLTVALAAAFAPERPTPRPPAAHVSWREAFAALGSNRALRRMILVDLCDAGALGVVTSLFVFLSRDVWGLGGMSSILLLVYVISGVACLAPILKFARKRSKSRTASWIALWLACALPLLLLVPAGNVWAAVACVLLLGAPSATNSALFDSMMGDIAIADTKAHGRVRTGLFYALHLIMGRGGRGVAIAGAYAFLDHVGFHPNSANAAGAGAVAGFKLLYVGAPFLLMLAMAALLRTFPEDDAARN